MQVIHITQRKFRIDKSTIYNINYNTWLEFHSLANSPNVFFLAEPGREASEDVEALSCSAEVAKAKIVEDRLDSISSFKGRSKLESESLFPLVFKTLLVFSSKFSVSLLHLANRLVLLPGCIGPSRSFGDNWRYLGRSFSLPCFTGEVGLTEYSCKIERR